MNTPVQTTFKDCDEYASYVLESLLDFGANVTEEFNSYTGLSLPIGSNVYEIKDLPTTGKNYAQFGTLKAWLYDLYEMHKEQDLTTIEIF